MITYLLTYTPTAVSTECSCKAHLPAEVFWPHHWCTGLSPLAADTRAVYILWVKKVGHPSLAHNFTICWPIFNFFFTVGLSSKRVMKWSLKTSYASLHYLLKRKCQESGDNLKEMSHLTINFNLILTIILIFVTMNIHNIRWLNAGMEMPTTMVNDILNKNLCGRDGRTICGPQRVPKSTCVIVIR